VHGEQRAAQALARQLHDQADWTAVVPNQGEVVLV
jgi:hypothetical protein